MWFHDNGKRTWASTRATCLAMDMDLCTYDQVCDGFPLVASRRITSGHLSGTVHVAVLGRCIDAIVDGATLEACEDAAEAQDMRYFSFKDGHCVIADTCDIEDYFKTPLFACDPGSRIETVEVCETAARHWPQAIACIRTREPTHRSVVDTAAWTCTLILSTANVRFMRTSERPTHRDQRCNW